MRVLVKVSDSLILPLETSSSATVLELKEFLCFFRIISGEKDILFHTSPSSIPQESPLNLFLEAPVSTGKLFFTYDCTEFHQDPLPPFRHGLLWCKSSSAADYHNLQQILYSARPERLQIYKEPIAIAIMQYVGFNSPRSYVQILEKLPKAKLEHLAMLLAVDTKKLGCSIEFFLIYIALIFVKTKKNSVGSLDTLDHALFYSSTQIQDFLIRSLPNHSQIFKLLSKSFEYEMEELPDSLSTLQLFERFFEISFSPALDVPSYVRFFAMQICCVIIMASAAHLTYRAAVLPQYTAPYGIDISRLLNSFGQISFIEADWLNPGLSGFYLTRPYSDPLDDPAVVKRFIETCCSSDSSLAIYCAVYLTRELFPSSFGIIKDTLLKQERMPQLENPALKKILFSLVCEEIAAPISMDELTSCPDDISIYRRRFEAIVPFVNNIAGADMFTFDGDRQYEEAATSLELKLFWLRNHDTEANIDYYIHATFNLAYLQMTLCLAASSAIPSSFSGLTELATKTIEAGVPKPLDIRNFMTPLMLQYTSGTTYAVKCTQFYLIQITPEYSDVSIVIYLSCIAKVAMISQIKPKDGLVYKKGANYVMSFSMPFESAHMIVYQLLSSLGWLIMDDYLASLEARDFSVPGYPKSTFTSVLFGQQQYETLYRFTMESSGSCIVHQMAV